MNRTLYEISADLAALDALLDDLGGDVSDAAAEAAIDQWFAELGAERDRKLDAYAGLIRDCETLAEAARAESVRLAALSAQRRSKAERLKARLKYFLEQHQITKLNTERFSFNVQRNGGNPPVEFTQLITDVRAQLPERFIRVIPEQYEMDRSAILDALRSGEALDFARLGEKGTHLRIK